MQGLELEKTLELKPIGVVRSPHEKPSGVPVQPRFAAGCRGQVILDPTLEPAITDLEGFERIWLIYWLDRSRPFRPMIVPFRDDREHGALATRVPSRPNPLGMSCVRLLERKGNVIEVDELDVLDGTPLLDVKPYVPKFDAYPEAAAGWFDEKRVERDVADGRFAPDEKA